MKLSSLVPALFFCGLVGFSSLRAQTTSVTRQPAGAVGPLGGSADFSFSVTTTAENANIDYSAQKVGSLVGVTSRFQVVSTSRASTNSSTSVAITLRIANLTAADAGSYQFSVYVNGAFPASAKSASATLTIGSVAAPAITSQPRGQTVPSFGTFALSVGASGLSLGYQWYKNGSPITGERSASFSPFFAATGADSGVYHVVVSNSGGSVSSENAIVIVSGSSGPSISRQASSVDVLLGQTATFSVGLELQLFSPNYQWLFNGAAIPGATDASFTSAAASATTTGSYAVIVTNSFGGVLSELAQLRIVSSSAPSISSQPSGMTVNAGQPVILFVGASGFPVPSYQWRKDGIAISGTTSSTLAIGSSKTEDSGTYSVVVSNTAGSVTSNGARLTVNQSIINPARLVNMSILTPLEAGETMTLGTVLGGIGTSGSKPLLIRAAGPSLAQLGVTDFMPDPRLDLYSGQTLTAVNNDWGGLLEFRSVFSAVGAFSYSAQTSLDAAIYNPALAAGNYTVQVRGVGLSAGTVIAELYDSTPNGTFTAATPRLINVSVLKTIRSGDTLTAGFVIGGIGAKTVLVRAVGPTLGQPPFNVAGVMADPKLTLYSGQQVLAANDNWGTQSSGNSAAGISASAESVGAFKIADVGSRDAVLLVTLTPGNYTAQVTASDGGSGFVLSEVYEVP